MPFPAGGRGACHDGSGSDLRALSGAISWMQAAETSGAPIAVCAAGAGASNTRL